MKSNHLPILTNERQISGKTQLPSFSFERQGSTYSFVVQVKFLFLIQKYNCPGSGQDRFIFCSSQKDTEVIFTPPHNTAGDKEAGSRSHITRLCMVSSHLWAIHLFRAHSTYYCCYSPFSYFTVVSCSFFFYQPPLTFCASNSPLQPPAEVRGEGSERAVRDLECFGESTKFGNTIPKPWQ